MNSSNTYDQKLDIYYVTTIAYMVTLLLYMVIAGSLVGKTFQIVWKDPIVYLLALCVIASLIALITAFVLDKEVVIEQDELTFNTRFKKRVIRPQQIESVTFTRGSRGKIRQGEAERAARIKLKGHRRRLWLRPANFDRSDEMMAQLRDWFHRNNVEVKRRSRRIIPTRRDRSE